MSRSAFKPKSNNLETELTSWRRALKTKPLFVTNIIYQVRNKLATSAAAKSDPNLINRALSQLKAGSATPQDFGIEF